MTKPGGSVKTFVDGRVLAVKTHEPLFRKIRLSNYTRAILLMRSPYKAMLAEFNRAEAGHTGHATKEAFDKSTVN